jgi:hypothetical protein
MTNPRGVDLDKIMLGDRPQFLENVQFTNESERKIALIKGLSYHGYLFNLKKDFPFFLKFVQEEKFCPQDQINDLKTAEEFISPTIMSLCKMGADGWIFSNKERDQILSHISEITARGNKITKNKKPEIPVVQQVQKKINNIVDIRSPLLLIFNTIDLDEEIWIKEKRIPSDDLSVLKDKVFDAKLTAEEFNSVINFIESKKAEYTKAYKKEDSDFVEGYGDYGQRMLGAIIKRLTTISEIVKEGYEKIKTVRTANKIRRPRKVSVVPANVLIEKQIKGLKFQPISAEYNISSVDPKKIIGGKILITFNTKYRTAAIYHANNPDGFSIKGTTIQGFDEAKSKSRGLRKPADILTILKTKTSSQFMVVWNNLTTIERVPNGRINEDTILLRVI